MVKFGAQDIPHVESITITYGVKQAVTPIPKADVAAKYKLGKQYAKITLEGRNYPANNTTMSNIEALADGTSRILDLEFSGGPTFTAIMTEVTFEPRNVPDQTSILFRASFQEVHA